MKITSIKGEGVGGSRDDKLSNYKYVRYGTILMEFPTLPYLVTSRRTHPPRYASAKKIPLGWALTQFTHINPAGPELYYPSLYPIFESIILFKVDMKLT